MNYRLDCIWQVRMAEECGEYVHWKELLKKNTAKCWGVSFGGSGHRRRPGCRTALMRKKKITY